MPKEVMSAKAPAATAALKSTPPATVTKPLVPAAPAAATGGVAEDPRIEAMRKRLEGMNLAPVLIKTALENEKKKLGITGAAVEAAPPAQTEKAAPVAQTPAKAQATESKKAPAPVVAPAAAAAVSDEEFAAQLQQEEAAAASDGSDLPPDETLPVPTRAAPAATAAAAADVVHEDDEGPAAMVVRNAYSDMSGGALSGPIDRTDFKTPQIKLVQGSGPLSQKFNQGTLIFLDTAIFPAPDPDKPGPPLNFIPVSIQKYFRENLTKEEQKNPDGTTRQPRNVSTFEEVQRLGGTTEFTVDSSGARIKPTWSAAARCTLIIERPEGNTHPGFTLAMEIDGKERWFAPAIMFVNGGQYRAFVKPIIDATAFILSEGSGADRRIVLEKRVWKMQVVKEKSGENMVFNPKLTMLPELTPEDLKAYAQSLRG